MKNNNGIATDEAETAALVVDGSQPAWMTLNEARERAFTGEIVFETDPEVLAYLDNGIVYYAERASDVALGRRLLDAGVIDIDQLERGTVRVGDIEHLGRLFDRDPSVDRDAVIVVAETSTQELITNLANQAIVTVRVTAYRHHSSGLHRWFVAPLDPSTLARPLSAVAQLDTTVVDQLPGLSFGDADELIIEWDDEFDDPAALYADEFELSLDLAEFTDDVTGDDDAAAIDAVSVDAVADETVDEFDFAFVWPDGTEESTIQTSAPVEESTIVDEPTDDGNIEFTMPPLTLDAEPEAADVEVPDEVAEAVRRAIAAIESAGIAAADGAPGADAHVQLAQIADVEIVDEVDDICATAPESAPMVAAELSPPAPAAELSAPTLGGFAPPTMAMRAEVLYGQMDEDGTTALDGADAVAGPIVGESLPTGGVASVVFVDDPADENSGGGNDRSSALRRLIGSLRRKDH